LSKEKKNKILFNLLKKFQSGNCLKLLTKKLQSAAFCTHGRLGNCGAAADGAGSTKIAFSCLCNNGFC
jgi:hypothetical protein